MAVSFTTKAGRVTIRTVNGRADFEPMTRIERAAFRVPITDAVLLSILGHRKRRYVGRVATLEGEIVGYLIHESRGAFAEIVRMAVYPLLHRHGVGRALLEGAAVGMRQGKAAEVLVRVEYTGIDQPAGRDRSFFNAAGFSFWNRDNNWYGDGRQACRLHKRLDGESAAK